MMDREMLEMAARAAGYVVESHHVSGGAWVHPVGEMPDADGDYPGLFLWRPREDDGDAQRLAVALSFGVFVSIARATSWVCDQTSTNIAEVLHDDAVNFDPYAATRRAITRAAAEIGRQMEESND